jgi:hypothetical protein
MTAGMCLKALLSFAANAEANAKKAAARTAVSVVLVIVQTLYLWWLVPAEIANPWGRLGLSLLTASLLMGVYSTAVDAFWCVRGFRYARTVRYFIKTKDAGPLKRMLGELGAPQHLCEYVETIKDQALS